eukprot:459003_1
MRALSIVFKLFTILFIADITRSSTDVISCVMNACHNTTVDCIHDQDCFVSCSSANGCQNSIINCPLHQECIVLCDDIQSCKGTIINGSRSSVLGINGCIQDQSCLNLSVYCPQSVQTDPNCLFKDNDNLGAAITIHAVYGWNQINIEYDGTSSTQHNIHGTLYCDRDYDTSCDIASDTWTCVEKDHTCNHISYIQSTIQTTVNYTDTGTESMIETEMLIIVSTMVAAFCFISLCCWLNRYKQDHKPTTNKAETTNTVTKYKKGEDQHYTSQTHGKTIPKTRTKSEPIRTKKTGKNEHAQPHTQAHAPRTRKSTGGSTRSKASRTPRKRQKRAETTPAKYMAPPVDAKVETAKERKTESRAIDMADVNHVRPNEKEKVNEKPMRNAGNTRRKVENDLAVITESQPVETNENVYKAKANNKRLQFRQDASDSDTLDVRSQADTWNNFDQENGILADRVNMTQMMGFLEEGAIACSYE